ncbi:hypothetical protein ACWIVU_08115 [Ursidibacter arcticus]
MKLQKILKNLPLVFIFLNTSGQTANIDHLNLETKNLHIESVQDSEKYDSKQTQGGVTAAFAWGSGGSASAQFSQNKAKVDYAQVTQQSGFNINNSSTINVTENTHLKGGIINAQGDKANHTMKTGTLTTESIENHSDIKISTISAGASTDMSQMATMAMGAALSALGNMNESERSQTHSAISQNINLTITDSDKQKALTGKTAEETLQSLNRDVAGANQKLEKQDLQAIQERQEATQIMAEMGAKAVGDLAQYMNWEDGSPQKIALHGLVGYLSAKVGGGNVAASTLSAMGSEYINTEIANYLKENTALTEDQRNAIQQASAAGLGALIGAGLGGDSNTVNQSAQMALRTEQFNRQLHPEEKQRIKDLANGDKEKELRLTAAACALVHCSAQIPSDDPEYAKAKALEDLGNSAEFASERALLSKQVGTIGNDAFAAGTLKPMFNYNNVYRVKDYDDANLQVMNRAGGLAQATGGVAATALGVGMCETGLGCVGGVPVAAYGVDNTVAGARTMYSGKYTSTVGAKALAELTGISETTSEFLYGIPSISYGGIQNYKFGSTIANKISDKIQGIKTISPYDPRFSQSSVSFNKIDRVTGERYTYDDIKLSMSQSGWKGQPIDIVQMKDGKLTSMDNTRLTAARETLTDIKVKIHSYNEHIPTEVIQQRQWSNNQWGKVIEERINKQSKTFRNENPNGSDFMPKVNRKEGQ